LHVLLHADNENFTWTLLNSWGSGKDPNNTRDKGITADGLFKVRVNHTPLCDLQLLAVPAAWLLGVSGVLLLGLTQDNIVQ
jgi:hypothetical protein